MTVVPGSTAIAEGSRVWLDLQNGAAAFVLLPMAGGSIQKAIQSHGALLPSGQPGTVLVEGWA